MSRVKAAFTVPATNKVMFFNFKDFYDFKQFLQDWLKYAEVKKLEISVEKEEATQ